MAAGWREYTYPKHGFAIHFPADPEIEDTVYMTSDGVGVPARVYSLRQGDTVFSVTVADLSDLSTNTTAVLNDAIAVLNRQGQVRFNLPARVDHVFGRQLSIANAQGGHSNVAIFYNNLNLYLVEGTVLPGGEDPNAGTSARFQESMHFVGGLDPEYERSERGDLVFPAALLMPAFSMRGLLIPGLLILGVCTAVASRRVRP